MELISTSLLGVFIVIVCLIGVITSAYILISLIQNKKWVNPHPDSAFGKYVGHGASLKVKLFIAGIGMLFGWVLLAWAILFRT